MLYIILSKPDNPTEGNINVSTATVSMYVKGILTLITFLITKYTPPKRSARDETSPIQPPMLPINISNIPGRVPSSDPFIIARGVADDTVSAGIINPVVKGADHLVIITGQDASRKALPTKAGFIKL